MSGAASRLGVPVGMFTLGMATGFVLRDELTMPTYIRIKMALVEHAILTRRKLNTDVLGVLDPNQGKVRLIKQQERALKEHSEKLNELRQGSSAGDTKKP